MKVKFGCTEMNFNFAKRNLRKDVASLFPGVSQDDITDSLVMYDPRTNTVTVDEHADDSYTKYAAIHECICCGPYRELAPKTDNPHRRCGLIDKMIIETMPKGERKAFIDRRIEMFNTLIERHLNTPLEADFEQSISMLESLLVDA